MSHEPECRGDAYSILYECVCDRILDAYKRGRGEHLRDVDKQIIEVFPKAGEFEATIQRVRELHTWVTTTSVYDPDHKKICAACSQYHDCEEWGLTTGKSVLVKVEYPCPTIKALDGEQ